MEDSKPTSHTQRLSAQVRARRLFQREGQIDKAGDTEIFTEKTLEGLVKQRADHEKQRTIFLRHLTIIIFVMILVSNGQDISIPILNMKLSSIPGLNPLLGFFASISLFFAGTSSITVGAYTGLIDQFSNKISGDTTIDPDIFSASVSPQQLFLKIMRIRFNTYHSVHITPLGVGKFVYNSSVFLTVLMLVSVYGLMYSYVGYFLVYFVENDVVGIASKVLSLFILFLSLYLHWASNWPFKQRVELS